MAIQYAVMAGFQVISGLQQAEMVRMQADIQKEIDDFNAQMAEYDAWKVETYGQTQVAMYQQQIDQAQAAAKVSAAGAGVDIRSGSLSEITAQNELVGLANKLEIENQTREKALGYKRQARSIQMGSAVNQAVSKAQQSSIIGGALLQAAGTVLKGSMGASGGTKQPMGSESGYSLNGSQSLSMSQPGSYLTGTSQDLNQTTGYLGLP